MKVAIVGTSRTLSDNEDRDARQIISMILDDYNPKTTTIISGGAKGIDTMAVEIAYAKHFDHIVTHNPEKPEKKYYLERNVKIALGCDVLFCITTPTHDKKCYHHDPIQDHEKTAGCYTMNKALLQKKNCKLIVTPKRD